MVTFLIISGKLAILGLFKIMLFWNKYYNVIIFVHGVTKNLSRDSKYIVDAVLWSNFGKSSISLSFHNLDFIRIWPEKTIFWGVLFVQVQ